MKRDTGATFIGTIQVAPFAGVWIETVTKNDNPNIVNIAAPQLLERHFPVVASIIIAGRSKAYQSVNSVLIETYWHIGQYINRKVAAAEWGDGVVNQLAVFLHKTLSDPRGYSARNLWRMVQFYDIYGSYEKVSTLLTQIPWSSYLLIISKTKRKLALADRRITRCRCMDLSWNRFCR